MPKGRAKTKIDLNELAKEFDENNKKDLGMLELIERAKFMQDILVRLEKQLKKEEPVTDMCQGRYSIKRKNPALQAYNDTIKNYTSLIKDISDKLPEGKDKKDLFEDFD